MYTCNCSGNNKFPRCCSRNCRSLVKHKKKKLFIPISAATLPISFLPLHPYTYILHSCLLERTSQINSKKENRKKGISISRNCRYRAPGNQVMLTIYVKIFLESWLDLLLLAFAILDSLSAKVFTITTY